MNYIIDWKNIILLSTLLVNFILVLLSYFRSKKKRVNLAWSLVVATVIFWIASMILFRAVNLEKSIFWCRMLYIAAAFIPAAFLRFSYLVPSFSDKKRPLSKIMRIGLVFSLLLIVLLVILPDFIIKNVTIKPGEEKEIIWGPFYFLYVIYISTYFSLALFKLFKKWLEARGNLRIQLKYILIGTSISIFLGSAFNLFLPTFGYFQLNWAGQVSTLFMVAVVSYAIAKYQLLGIRTILTEFSVMIIALILLVQAILTETSWLRVLNFLVFGLFLGFGYLLIKSVWQEIERRKKIEKMSEQLKKAYKELKKLDVAKSEFIAMASHQLRTPLSIVKGYVSMLMEGSYGEAPERFKKPLQNVFSSNERLVKIINDLLDISKIELGKTEVSKEKVQLESLIDSVVNELMPEAENKGIDLKWEKPEKPLPKIEIDPLKINQVIACVVDNAIKYTKKGGVVIKTEKLKSKIRIIISDTGAGMSKDERNKIFESFTRGTAGINLWVQGTGLGLYLAKKYVQLHKGKIWAESPGRGKGSTFYIELPVK